MSTLYANAAGRQNLELEPENIAASLFGEFPLSVAVSAGAVPLHVEGDTLLVGMLDPNDLDAVDAVTFSVNRGLELFLADASFIARTHARWRRWENQRAELDSVTGMASSMEVEQVDEASEEGQMASLVAQLLSQAADVNASDIHIKPNNEELLVVFRVDGVMEVHQRYPLAVARGLINRIKIMAMMNISERRVPQDGRFGQTLSDGRRIDCRVVTHPTAWEYNNSPLEGSVMRLFDQSRGVRKLEDIGFHPYVLDTLEQVLESPTGLILVTGPTGSGKTTSLYGALTRVATPGRNTMAIEDPTEIKFPAISQLQVNEDTKLTFATALRSFLRSDPDVMLVGEIRDEETARLAARAAQTGHLVLSTVHANDAASSVARVRDLGLTDNTITSVLRAVMAQRLLRAVCSHCKVEYSPEEAEFAAANWPQAWARPEKLVRAAEKGCGHCGGRGYSGRVVIAELMVIDTTLADLIESGASSREIGEHAARAGIPTLHEDALAWVESGHTTLEEVKRVGL